MVSWLKVHSLVPLLVFACFVKAQSRRQWTKMSLWCKIRSKAFVSVMCAPQGVRMHQIYGYHDNFYHIQRHTRTPAVCANQDISLPPISPSSLKKQLRFFFFLELSDTWVCGPVWWTCSFRYLDDRRTIMYLQTLDYDRKVFFFLFLKASDKSFHTQQPCPQTKNYT